MTTLAYAILLGVAIYVGIWAINPALAWIARRNAETDAQMAADHGEPTRAEVEAEWADAPIRAATIAHIAKQAAAELDDEWARICDQTGGAA